MADATVKVRLFATLRKKYGIKELSHGALALALPTNAGTFGLSYSYFGYSKYNESKIGLAYAKKLFEKISAVF